MCRSNRKSMWSTKKGLTIGIGTQRRTMTTTLNRPGKGSRRGSSHLLMKWWRIWRDELIRIKFCLLSQECSSFVWKQWRYPCPTLCPVGQFLRLLYLHSSSLQRSCYSRPFLLVLGSTRVESYRPIQAILSAFMSSLLCRSFEPVYSKLLENQVAFWIAFWLISIKNEICV